MVWAGFVFIEISGAFGGSEGKSRVLYRLVNHL